jgi:sirohydrochlorin cobaltochelatase
MKHNALILFAHGARNSQWALPFERLQQLIQAQRPELHVSLAFLELMQPRLPDVVQQLVQSGYAGITVVPVFFGQGGHLLRDLPEMVDALRTTYPDIVLNVAGTVGEDADVLNAIASYCISAVEGVRPTA